MPASDLKSLREYVANILDYNPTNPTYARQIDRLLNEADLSICSSKPFTFVNKAAEITAYKDSAATIACTNGSTTISHSAGFFEQRHVNQEIEIDGGTYVINYVQNSLIAVIASPFTGATGPYTGTVINRYLDLPADCTTVLGVARRTNTRTPNSPGMLSPLTRYEDEWNNLPLGEVNLPVYWLYHDPAFINGPRRGFGVSVVTAGAGQGTRTIEFTSTYVRGGRESSHGEVVSLTAVEGQDIRLTPAHAAGASDEGFRKRYYFRCRDLGYGAFRLLKDPTAPGDYMDLEHSDVAVRTLGTLTYANLTGTEQFLENPRMDNPDGFTQRIRLYPRQDEDYVFTIRYMAKHQEMREDSDVSAIPPDQRMVIAYKALADVLIKHGNQVQSELYRRRYDEMLLRIERRYLVTPSRRIVKGNWLVNMEPNGFSRFTTLVHT